MPQTGAIKTVRAAFAMMKAMQGGDYRQDTRRAVAEIIDGRWLG